MTKALLLATSSARAAQAGLGITLFAELRFDGFRDTMVGVNVRRMVTNDDALTAHLLGANEGESVTACVARLAA